jgi:hypothetical protein
MTDVVAFVPFIDTPIWLAWALETRVRGALPTKVPYAATGSGPGRRDFGSSTDPKTWGIRMQAEARAKQLVDGEISIAGIGVVLGDLGDGTALVGVDLDSSIDENGCLARWGSAILAVLQTYSEVSPSGSGIKAFCRMHAEHVRPFFDSIGVPADQWGIKRGIPGFDSGNHGPAIEIYCGGRYFTVTERLWSVDHQQIALLGWPQLEALAALVPAGAVSSPGDRSNSGSNTPKPGNGLDNSRSARALRAALQRRPDTFEEMVEHLRHHPDDRGIREWTAEVDNRQLRRLWERFCEARAAERAAELADLDARIGTSDDTEQSEGNPQPQLPPGGPGGPKPEPGGANPTVDTPPRIAPVPEGQPDVKWAGEDLSPIPPRQWLLGTNFCCGYLSGLTGAGSTGKTALRLLQLIALALGRGELVGDHCFRRTKVLIVYLEDDEEELRRRISAACRYRQIDQTELVGWLAYWTPKDLRLIEVSEFRKVRPGGLAHALEHIIKRLDIGLVSIDPFVKSHGADENDNNLIDQAATMFLSVAHACGCACDYVHHDRKGISVAGDADRARGASSLVNASRLLKTLSKMTQVEAKALGVKDSERKFLVRLDDAKINIAPPSEETVWFKLVDVAIGNPTEAYPKGDHVQTVEPWVPPDPFAGLARATILEIFKALRAGPEPGEFYLSDVKADEDWAGRPICKLASKEEDEAKRILKTWIKNGVLIEDEYTSPKRKHKKRNRLIVNEDKAREILGELYELPKTRPAKEPSPEQTALESLRKMIKYQGVTPSPEAKIPHKLRPQSAVRLDEWCRVYRITEDIIDGLKNQITHYDGWVWIPAK